MRELGLRNGRPCFAVVIMCEEVACGGTAAVIRTLASANILPHLPQEAQVRWPLGDLGLFPLLCQTQFGMPAEFILERVR